MSSGSVNASLYLGNVILNGGGGGSVSDLEAVRIQPADGIYFVDENGYIGMNAKDKFLYGSYTYACTYAIVAHGCDFSDRGLGKVTFFTDYDYGTLSFEGFDYRTITIGDQTWMVDNMRYAISGSYYQNDSYLGKYGRLYTWQAAKNVAALVEGWHLPSAAEWDKLAQAVGGSAIAGTKLKDKTFSGGTDDYGFSVLPAGRYSSGSFSNVGSYGYFWTSTENSSSFAYYRYFSSGASMSSDFSSKTNGYSVRLVKDS